LYRASRWSGGTVIGRAAKNLSKKKTKKALQHFAPSLVGGDLLWVTRPKDKTNA
jgi:hypothetical protein